LSARRGSGVVACLAVTLGHEWRYGLPVQTLRLLGSLFADRVDRVVAPDAAGLPEPLLATLAHCAKRWGAPYLSEFVVAQDLRERICSWPSLQGHRWARRRSSHYPVLSLEIPAPPVARRSSVRRELHRRRKKLFEFGDVVFKQVRASPDDVDGLIA